ncbi:energy transducer TonB [Epilithonimonas sp.]|uniref:energy transducer TonB n=1 Tax=Epilithonimonas sp. TaxID=2894511 RepID=UPI0035B1DEBD
MKRIISLLLIVVCSSAFSQQTTYQKKIRELKIDYWIKIGLTKSFAEKLVDNKLTSKETQELKKIDKAIFISQNSPTGLELTKKLNLDLKDAEKLKTTAEINIENSENFKNTDMYFLKNQISNKIQSWLKKGEFEKTDDYNLRINSKSLDSIFKKSALTNIEYLTRIYDGGHSGTEIKLGKYNADKELFEAYLKSEKFNITGNIKVPFDEAQKFKIDYNDYRPKLDLIDLKIWKNNLVPTKLKIYNKQNENSKEYTAIFDFNQTELKDIILTQNDTFYSNYNLNFDLVREESENKIMAARASNAPIQAEFPNGIQAFRHKVSNNLDTSNVDAEGEVSATISFIVEIDGTLSNISVKGNNNSFNKAAAEAVKQIKTKWIPAKENQKDIRSQFSVVLNANF